jgi:hypothetical protein
MTDLRFLAAKILKHYASSDDKDLAGLVDALVAKSPLDRGAEGLAPVVSAEERNLLNLLGGYMAEANERTPLALTAQGCGDDGGGDDDDDGDDDGEGGDGDGEGGEADGGESESESEADADADLPAQNAVFASYDVPSLNPAETTFESFTAAMQQAADKGALGEFMAENQDAFASVQNMVSQDLQSQSFFNDALSTAYDTAAAVSASQPSSLAETQAASNPYGAPNVGAEFASPEAQAAAAAQAYSDNFGFGPLSNPSTAMDAGPTTTVGSMIGAADYDTWFGPAANATGALSNNSLGAPSDLASPDQQTNAPTESPYGPAPDLTINKGFSNSNPQDMSSTGYNNQSMSSTGYNNQNMSSTGYDNLVDLVGGRDAFNAAYGSPPPLINMGAPTPLPLSSVTPTTTTTTPAPAPSTSRVFSPLANPETYGAGPEHRFYMAEGGMASFPTMAYTDGQSSIAMPPGLSPYDTAGADVLGASPMAPPPAAAAPNFTSPGPLSASMNANAGQFPSQISQNPNLGYSLGQSPLSRLTRPTNG